MAAMIDSVLPNIQQEVVMAEQYKNGLVLYPLQEWGDGKSLHRKSDKWEVWYL